MPMTSVSEVHTHRRKLTCDEIGKEYPALRTYPEIQGLALSQ